MSCIFLLNFYSSNYNFGQFVCIWLLNEDLFLFITFINKNGINVEK